MWAEYLNILENVVRSELEGEIRMAVLIQFEGLRMGEATKIGVGSVGEDATKTWGCVRQEGCAAARL